VIDTYKPKYKIKETFHCMRVCGAYVRTGVKTGWGLRKGGFVKPATTPRIKCGVGVRKTGKNAGKIYTKYK
jgi:hypothetical protein